MVRKISAFILIIVLVLSTLCVAAQAESFTSYNGTISSTYITYYKDIVSNIKLTDNYVVFRAGQNDYKMVVGELNYNNNFFHSDFPCKVYSFTSGQSVGNNTIYNVSTIDWFSLDASNNIVYSDLGDYPQLETRGIKHEILNTILLSVALLCIVIWRIFNKR